MEVIKEKLKGVISENSNEEVNKITGDVVKQACCRMKPGKIDVTSSYSSDFFLKSPDVLFDLLASVFHSPDN